MEMKKILVIDDEPSLLKIMGKFLDKLKWIPVTAETGEIGQNLFKEDPSSFYGVIIDYNLPNESSEDILVSLKSLSPNLKLVLSTGFAVEEISRQYTKITIDKTLQKPFSLTDFKQMLDVL